MADPANPRERGSLAHVWHELLGRTHPDAVHAMLQAMLDGRLRTPASGRKLPFMAMYQSNMFALLDALRLLFSPRYSRRTNYALDALGNSLDVRMLTVVDAGVHALPDTVDTFALHFGENPVTRDSLSPCDAGNEGEAAARADTRVALFVQELRGAVLDDYSPEEAWAARAYDRPILKYMTMALVSPAPASLPEALYLLVAPNGMAAVYPDLVTAGMWCVQRPYIMCMEAAELEALICHEGFERGVKMFVNTISGAICGRRCVPTRAGGDIGLHVADAPVVLHARHSNAERTYFIERTTHCGQNDDTIWEQRIRVSDDMWVEASDQERREAEADAPGALHGRNRYYAPAPHFMSIRCQVIMLGDREDVMRADAYWARHIAWQGTMLGESCTTNGTPSKLYNNEFEVVHGNCE